ncbi:Protein tyrosine phosphatase prl-1 [Cladochytrium tenue]|nr:Protein tyrosine phosphatase prl-1 [Cladochytrium tenue]
MPARTIPFSRVMTSIDYRNMRFVVFDCPTDTTLPFYVEELRSRGVTDIVRVCEPTYNKEYCASNGIKVWDWPFPDGTIPPASIINGFLGLCDDRFPGGIAGAASHTGEGDAGTPAVAVHCVAGLGRAPVLVAVAMIEAGMAPLDAVEFIRRRRRGAFNTVQLAYLVDSYRRSWTKKSLKMSSFLASKRTVSPGAAAAAATTPALAGTAATSPPSPAPGASSGDEDSSVGVNGQVSTTPKPRLKESFSKVFGGFRKKDSN